MPKTRNHKTATRGQVKLLRSLCRQLDSEFRYPGTRDEATVLIGRMLADSRVDLPPDAQAEKITRLENQAAPRGKRRNGFVVIKRLGEPGTEQYMPSPEVAALDDAWDAAVAEVIPLG